MGKYRFRGELFGLGSNHTKYKGGKGQGQGNYQNTTNGGNGNGNGPIIQQMQYSGQVHYPSNATAQQMQQHLANAGGYGSMGSMGGYDDNNGMGEVY